MKLNLSRLQEMLLENEETREEGRELYESILDALNGVPAHNPSQVREWFMAQLNEEDGGEDD